ncbi:MAG: ABC transporter permease [Candidatus Firestonebacteria bacterium]
MGIFRQVIRSVEYYYPAGFAAALAVAAAMAALTGSLFVGGSVERSLKETALERLGDINYSVSTAGYFRESLAENIYKNITPSGGELTAPAIILTGTVSNLSSGITVPNVNIIGVNEEFFGLYEAAFRKGEKVNGRKAAMSKALGDIFGDLRLRPDQNIIVTLQKTGLAPRESIFGRQKTEEAVIKARFESSGTLPAYGPGAFNLKNEAAPPRNLYVSLSFLQSLLGLEGKANTVLAAFVNKNTDFSEAVKKALTLKDYGLKTVKGRACFYLESENLLLSDYLAKKASEAAVKAGLKAGKASVYLVKTVNGKMPYSVLAGFEDFPVRQGAVALSPWAQEDLGAAEGGLLKVVFLKGSGKAGVREESRDYIAAGTLPEKYLDLDIVPKFEGITDAGSMADWNPPFKVEHSLIRPKDENYWKDFKTTPKAAVSFGEAVSYWKEESPAYSGVTSVRVEGDENIFTDTLLGLLEPGPGGITVANTAAEALAGSRPSSDYSGLFTALSAFIVFSALGLVWLIFGLLAEKRSAETGLLLAFGFGSNRVLRILLFEGAVYAFFGVLVGLILSFYYTDYFVNLLSRSWKSAGVEIGVFKPYYGAGAGLSVISARHIGMVSSAASSPSPPTMMIAACAPNQLASRPICRKPSGAMPMKEDNRPSVRPRISIGTAR